MVTNLSKPTAAARHAGGPFFAKIKLTRVTFQSVRAAIAPGGLLVADNVLGSHTWWIDEPPGRTADRDGADRFNRMVAADADFETVAVPLREGVLIARRRSAPLAGRR